MELSHLRFPSFTLVCLSGCRSPSACSSWTNPRRHTPPIPPLLVLCLSAIPLLQKKGHSRKKVKWGKIQRDSLPSLWGAFTECLSTVKWWKQIHFCCYHSSLGPLKKRNNSSQKKWISTFAVCIICDHYPACLAFATAADTLLTAIGGGKPSYFQTSVISAS